MFFLTTEKKRWRMRKSEMMNFPFEENLKLNDVGIFVLLPSMELPLINIFNAEKTWLKEGNISYTFPSAIVSFQSYHLIFKIRFFPKRCLFDYYG